MNRFEICKNDLVETEYNETNEISPSDYYLKKRKNTIKNNSFLNRDFPETELSLSILVPIYNVENYLVRCLKSIQNQTFKDFEVLCINDGSTDGSLDIIKSFTEGDNRFKLIDKKNSGYGSSMNIGLHNARGQYIGIVESDDFIHKDMYATLYEKTFGKVDIVKCNFYDYYSEEKKIINTERSALKSVHYPFSLEEVPEISIGHPSIWSAIYRRRLLFDNNIKFLEEPGGGWVDNPFFYETLCTAKKIIWVNQPLYFYFKTRPESSSNLQTNPNLPFKRMYQNLDVVEKYSKSEKLKAWTYKRALVYVRGVIKDFDYNSMKDKIDGLSRDLMKRLDENIVLKYLSKNEQIEYYKYRSPINKIKNSEKKILIYNCVPFDNPWNFEKKSSDYCKKLIEEIQRDSPNLNIYFISSGFAYDATRDDIYVQKIDNVFGDKVQQYEIVNSPIPLVLRYSNISIPVLKCIRFEKTFTDFLNKYGKFDVIHFNTIKGLSFDVFDLKKKNQDTKFIFTFHDLEFLSKDYFIDDNKQSINISHEFQRIQQDFKNEVYQRAIYGRNKNKIIEKKQWLDTISLLADDIFILKNKKYFEIYINNIINNSFDSIILDNKKSFTDNFLAKNKKIKLMESESAISYQSHLKRIYNLNDPKIKTLDFNDYNDLVSEHSFLRSLKESSFIQKAPD